MKVIRLIMVIAMLLTLAVMTMADTSDNANLPSSSDQTMNQSTTSQPTTSENIPSSPVNLRARYESGPVMRAGYPASADVFVGSQFALRIASNSGDLTPRQRARIITNRLNQAFKDGYTWNDLRVGQINGLNTVNIADRLIATVSPRDARAFRMPASQLASRWATDTVVALNGQPMTIASNLQPVTRVAGSIQQMGVMPFTTKNTKSVPLMFVANGNQLGNGIVAGSQNALTNINAVAVYQNTNGQATIWTFVPITGTSISGALTRVPGVGLVSAPTSLAPTGFQTGSGVMQMTSSMGMSWNRAINLQLSQAGVPTNAGTKIVPLYSMDMNQVIGAAQVMGNAKSLRQAQAVIASTNGSMYDFFATTTQCTPMAGKPTPLTDVVLSSIIMIVPKTETTPTMTQPTAPSEPSTVQPTPPQPEVTPPAPPAAPEMAPSAPAPAEPSAAPMTTPSSPTPGVAPPSTSEQQTTPNPSSSAPVVPDEGAPGSGY